MIEISIFPGDLGYVTAYKASPILSFDRSYNKTHAPLRPQLARWFGPWQQRASEHLRYPAPLPQGILETGRAAPRQYPLRFGYFDPSFYYLKIMKMIDFQVDLTDILAKNTHCYSAVKFFSK